MNTIQDETKFNTGSWWAIGLSGLILLICLLQIGYRMSLPSEGWVFPLEVSAGEQRYLFSQYFESRPTLFQAGDVLVSIEGRPVAELIENAIKLRPQRPANWQAGQTVQYTVLRAGQKVILDVVLQPRSLRAYLAGIPAGTAWSPGLLVTAVMGLIIFILRPGSRATQFFLVWSTVVLSNLLSMPVSGQNGSPAEMFYVGAYWPASFFNLLIYPLGIEPMLNHLFLFFPIIKTVLQRRPRLTPAAIYGFPFLVLGPALFTKLDQPLQFWITILNVGFPILTPINLLIPIISLSHTLRTAAEPAVRAQARWLLTGFILGWVMGNNILFFLPEFGVIEKSLPLTVITALCVLAFPVSLVVAIFRYRLFDIDIIIRRTLIYGALVGGLALLYVGSIALLQVLSQALTGPQSNLVVVAITLVIAALFNPIRRRFQEFIDRRFYREKVDARQALIAFAREVRTLIDLPELLRALVSRTTALLYISHGAVFLADEAGTFRLAESRSLPPEIDQHLTLADDNLARLQNGQPISRSNDPVFPLLVPLIAPTTPAPGAHPQSLIGILALGPRLSEQDYSREDQSLLTGLADQAGTAIYVAQLIAEKQAEAQRREESEHRLAAYRNSPAGRAEALAQSLLANRPTALSELHALTQKAGTDPDTAATLEALPAAVTAAGSPLLAGLADGYRYLLAGQSAPELLPVALRELITQLKRSEAGELCDAAQALTVYECCRQALKANSIPQIAECNLQVELANNAQFLTGLARGLAQLHPAAEALHAYERVDASQDKLAYLASAVERLSHVDHLARTELSPPDRPIIERLVSTWLTVVTGVMSELQTRARLTCRLLTRRTWSDEIITLTLAVRNQGRGAALDVRVSLAPAPEYTLLDEAVQIERLAAGEERRIEVRVRPRLAQNVSQFRAHFALLYDDPHAAGQLDHFADVVFLLVDAGEFQFIPNPYVVGTPLQTGSPLFFGRDDIIQVIQENLLAAHQNNLVLIGQRRTGKTSLLKQLPARLDERYVPVYLDGQSLALDPGLANFFHSLATEISFALEDQGFDLATGFELADFADSPAATFERSFLPTVHRAMGERYLLLLLDEFEELETSVRRGNLDPSIFGFLRHLIQHTANLSVIFCGTHRLEELAADYWSVLFNISLYRHVAFLSREEALRLIQEPVLAYNMHYDDLALDKMWHITAGHPYFLQLLCHNLVNRHNRSERNYVTVAEVNAALDEILAAGEAHFIYLWTESSYEERLALTALSRMMPLTGRAVPLQVADYLAERGVTMERRLVAQTLHRLVLRDILRTRAANGAENTDIYSWQMGLLGLWVEKYKSLSRVVDEV